MIPPSQKGTRDKEQNQSGEALLSPALLVFVGSLSSKEASLAIVGNPDKDRSP